MPNTKPIGVAYADPELVSGTTITGAVISGGSASGLTSLSGADVTATGDLYVASATVAATGSTQTDAAQLAGGFTLVSAADATKGVKLPAAVPGRVVIIKNGANAVLKVWPSTGDAINAIAANSNYVLAANTASILVAYDSTTWYSVPLLAS
jgi:hypothetical protein